MNSHRVIILGAFPPPVHGASKNNAILAERLEKSGVDVTRLDVAVPGISHARTGFYHLQRLWRNVMALHGVVKNAQKGSVFYMVPDGGAGIWYSLIHFQVATKRYDLLVLHHRTHKYIDSISSAMVKMTELAPDKTVHVFLTHGMASRFVKKYGACRAIVASNARFVEPDKRVDSKIKDKNDALHLGYLSNLCREKGFYEVVDTFRYLHDAGMNITLDLAGPAIEEGVQSTIDALQISYGSKVRHWGYIKPHQKSKFYKKIDVFLFPTQYKLEAAPNVVYEALSASVPVIATDRGCIPDIVTGLRGVVINRTRNYSELASKILAIWSSEAESLLRRKTKILHSIQKEHNQAGKQYDGLIKLMNSNMINAPLHMGDEQ